MKMTAFSYKLFIVAVFLVATSIFGFEQQNASVPRCKSEIYCSGDLLHTIQMSQIFKDSKQFVDMKLKIPEEKIVKKFKELKKQHGGKPSPDVLKQFVEKYFDEPGSEFETWKPSDWKEYPKFLNKINNPDYKRFGLALNDIWCILGRIMKKDVAANQDLYSIIHVEHGLIIPGGRFREFYYWDTYWIILGLLHSEMFETVKGMLGNFFSVIDRYGFVPNGGRIYYLTRSQPPMLTSMVQSYVDKLDKKEKLKFIAEAVPYLDTEFNFFMQHYGVDVNGHRLYRYGMQESGEPRPESYREDVITAGELKTTEKKKLYAELIAGAESGFDYSSRWFIKNGTNDGDLKDINARFIVPVELNAMLYSNAENLAIYHDELNHTDKAVAYKKQAKQIFDAVQAVLWNETVGTWFDFDLKNNKQRKYFAITNLAPLFFRCYNTSKAEEYAPKILKYVRTHIDEKQFPGGVPTTLKNTKQQWDEKNAWPPLQHMFIEGLRNLNDKEANKYADAWTKRILQSIHQVFQKYNGKMFEKYTTALFGDIDMEAGGEYEMQEGFGWTNGVMTDIMAKYCNKLELK